MKTVNISKQLAKEAETNKTVSQKNRDDYTKAVDKASTDYKIAMEKQYLAHKEAIRKIIEGKA